MKLMQTQAEMDHEQLVFCQDKRTGLRAIIAIHNTAIGPALGGCRFWDYDSEEAAITDVLRLSRGMTYKAAAAGLPLGGGKAVIIGDPKKLKSEALFRAFGCFVESLGGRYISAEDVNMRVSDIDHIAKETKYVTGVSERPGGSGDPSPLTALGVFHGIRAAVKTQLGKDSLSGLHVAIQGCGSVGRNLARLLTEAGARLSVADINPEAAIHLEKEYGARRLDVDSILRTSCDVLAPCALGGILNPRSISELQTTIVAGGANNQLLDEQRDGRTLREKNILYAPDYVINAGGLINVCQELRGYDLGQAKADVERIYDTLMLVFKNAAKLGISTQEASNALAEARVNEAREKSGGKPLRQRWGNQDWIKV